jgi:copper transport protein
VAGGTPNGVVPSDRRQALDQELVTRIHRPLGALLLALAGAVIAATEASAHTGFESSVPADGTSVDEPITTVTLVFTGDAEPTGTGFQILDPKGQLREPTEASTKDGSTWVLRFDPAIGPGAVGVRWMVKAPDAHPIEGSFSFTTEAPVRAAQPGLSPQAAAVPEPPDPAAANASNTGLDEFLDTGGDSTAVARRLAVASRVLTLLGTLVGVGALVFAVAVLRGQHQDIAHVLLWVRRAGVFVALGGSAELIAQTLVESGGGWSALSSPSGVGAVVTSSFGVAVALRIVGGLALARGARVDVALAEHTPDPVLVIRQLVPAGAVFATGRPGAPADGLREGRPRDGEERYVHHGDQAWLPTGDSAGVFAGAAAVIASYLFDGHTISKGDRLWTSIIDAVHVTGGAVWAGGVFMLVAVLWRRHRNGSDLRALQLAIRFSVVASMALVAVAIAGLALTVIVLDSPSELWSTDWGRTLLAKSVFVAAAAGAGGYNHKVLIPELTRSLDDHRLAGRFRRVVTGEAVALIGVLIATAILMGAAS